MRDCILYLSFKKSMKTRKPIKVRHYSRYSLVRTTYVVIVIYIRAVLNSGIFPCAKYAKIRPTRTIIISQYAINGSLSVDKV